MDNRRAHRGDFPVELSGSRSPYPVCVGSLPNAKRYLEARVRVLCMNMCRKMKRGIQVYFRRFQILCRLLDTLQCGLEQSSSGYAFLFEFMKALRKIVDSFRALRTSPSVVLPRFHLLFSAASTSGAFLRLTRIW